MTSGSDTTVYNGFRLLQASVSAFCSSLTRTMCLLFVVMTSIRLILSFALVPAAALVTRLPVALLRPQAKSMSCGHLRRQNQVRVLLVVDTVDMLRLTRILDRATDNDEDAASRFAKLGRKAIEHVLFPHSSGSSSESDASIDIEFTDDEDDTLRRSPFCSFPPGNDPPVATLFNDGYNLQR